MQWRSTDILRPALLVLVAVLGFSDAVLGQSESAPAGLNGSLVGMEGKYVEAFLPVDFLLGRWASIGRVQVRADASWNFGQLEVAGPVRWQAGGNVWRTWNDGGTEAFWALEMPAAGDGPLGARGGVVRQLGPTDASMGSELLEEAAVLRAAVSDSAQVWWQLQRTRLKPGGATRDSSLHARSSSDQLLALDSVYEAGIQLIANRAKAWADSTGRGLTLRAFLLADRWSLRTALNPVGSQIILRALCDGAPAPAPSDAAAWLHARALWSLVDLDDLDDLDEQGDNWRLARRLNALVRTPSNGRTMAPAAIDFLKETVQHPLYGPSAQYVLDQDASRRSPTANIPSDLLFFYPNNETVESGAFSEGLHLWLIVDASSPRAATEIDLLIRLSSKRPGPKIVVLDLGADWDAFTALVSLGRQSAIWLHAGGNERVMRAFDVHSLPKVLETGDELVYKKSNLKLPSQGMRWPPK
jgi:hypothetical protein